MKRVIRSSCCLSNERQQCNGSVCSSDMLQIAAGIGGGTGSDVGRFDGSVYFLVWVPFERLSPFSL